MIPIKNTNDRFGIIAITLHWIMAFLLIGLVALGLYMTRIPISVQKLQYFGWHKEFGILALMLVTVRLAFRLSSLTPNLNELPSYEIIAARLVHFLFYIFMFALPITGWLISSAAGLPVSFFGLFILPTLIAANEANQSFFAEIHEWLAYALIVTFILHVGAALKHYFINKDKILQRMLWP